MQLNAVKPGGQRIDGGLAVLLDHGRDFMCGQRAGHLHPDQAVAVGIDGAARADRRRGHRPGVWRLVMARRHAPDVHQLQHHRRALAAHGT
ncbi:hypothetical protein D3C87_1899330 [compost metagenome]